MNWYPGLVVFIYVCCNELVPRPSGVHFCMLMFQGKAIHVMLCEQQYVAVAQMLCELRHFDIAALFVQVCIDHGSIYQTEVTGGVIVPKWSVLLTKL